MFVVEGDDIFIREKKALAHRLTLGGDVVSHADKDAALAFTRLAGRGSAEAGEPLDRRANETDEGRPQASSKKLPVCGPGFAQLDGLSTLFIRYRDSPRQSRE